GLTGIACTGLSTDRLDQGFEQLRLYAFRLCSGDRNSVRVRPRRLVPILISARRFESASRGILVSQRGVLLFQARHTDASETDVERTTIWREPSSHSHWGGPQPDVLSREGGAVDCHLNRRSTAMLPIVIEQRQLSVNLPNFDVHEGVGMEAPC